MVHEVLVILNSEKKIYVSKEVNKCIFRWKINQWKIQFQLTLKLVSAVHQQQVHISKYGFYFYNLILYIKSYKELHSGHLRKKEKAR